MLFNVILLAISSSIDSFGIGITYGLRNLKITNLSKLILFIISISVTYLSILIGSNLSLILSPFIAKLLGSFVLISMGLVIVFQIITSKENSKQDIPIKKMDYSQSLCIEKKVYKFFIRFLGITIQIIKDPLKSDLDSSLKIDTKEAFYLGITLSIDSFCIGIGCGILGFDLILFPILVAIFQLLFLLFGTNLGKKISLNCKIPNNIWNFISAVLLIIIGISRLF